MATLILLSVVLVSVIIPTAVCTRPRPRRALRRAQWTVFAFIIVWAGMCILVYPEFVHVE